ncbi:MAG TPA: SelB C-terminal domain-containing protein [Actinomycetales bacterium]|nr:SelB C-terminal domain-containing protein [Actinomycetales bacterium]
MIGEGAGQRTTAVRQQVVATAGHVDHGKSALVRALTGMEPDRYAEERRRGMTIDLGFVWTTLDAADLAVGGPVLPTSGLAAGPVAVAFVDVPGHERFVSTMLAGVGPVPVVLLVVAADGGWMPQTEEHVAAVRALGVRHGLVAVSRSDLADPAPVVEDVRRRLAGTTLAGSPVVPVSSVTRAGLDQLRAELLRVLRSLPAPNRAADVRLWVDRSFTVAGAGAVVTGTLTSGTVRVGDELELHGRSGTRRVAVRGLQSLGTTHRQLGGVARIAVNLRGVASADVRRGDALVTPATVTRSDVLDVRLRRLDADSRAAGGSGGGREPRLPSQCLVHVGAAQVTGHLRPLDADHVRLRLSAPLPLRLGDRLLLREPSRHTVLGAAVALDVSPPDLVRRGDARRRAAALGARPERADVTEELRRRVAVPAADLRALGFTPSEVDAVRAVRSGGWLLDIDVAGDLLARLHDAVAQHSGRQVGEPGLTLEEARQLLDLPNVRMLHALLRPHGRPGSADVSTGGLVAREGRVVLAGAPEEALPAELSAAVDAVVQDLRRRPFLAPDAGRLGELGLDRRALAAAVRLGVLDRVAPGVHLLPDWRDDAVRVLAGLGESFTVSEARRALDTTRRVAVPLLELLDAEGVTRRLGNDRRVLALRGSR